MTYRHRHCTASDDYWRARAFFRALRIANPRPSESWHISDFDYWRWHWLENVVERPLSFHAWDSPDGEIAGVLVEGDPGVCHPMVAPGIPSEELRQQMLDIAESEHILTLQDGRRITFVWADETDPILPGVLSTRGYERSEGGHGTNHNAWQALAGAPAPVPLPSGYIVRSMGDVDELPARSLASWRSFHPDEPDEGADPLGDWYRNIQRAPLYRRDLDVVAVAENGDIASFALCYFDDVSRTGVFVLVGTAPPHQRKGLGKAVMTETLRRLHRLGAIGAYASWSEPVAGALYESVGFTDQAIGRAWRKTGL